MEKASTIWQHQPLSPVDEAAYWVELLMLHGHLDHMKIPDTGMNMIQYLSLDVTFILILGTILLIWTVFKIIRKFEHLMKKLKVE